MSYYEITKEPCFVCEAEDYLGEKRGTNSHPINCGWRLREENRIMAEALKENGMFGYWGNDMKFHIEPLETKPKTVIRQDPIFGTSYKAYVLTEPKRKCESEDGIPWCDGTQCDGCRKRVNP
jgi:hypothetical protein